MSEKLHLGDKSVIQGNVLSCVLYLLYILDIPTIFHTETHQIQETDSCKAPGLQTFIDDIMTTIQREDGATMQASIEKAIDTIEVYMRANKLSLNRDKTQLILLGRQNTPKSIVRITAQPEDIVLKPTIKFLGVTIADTLEWKQFLTDGQSNLYSQLKTRLSAIKN